MSTSFTQVAELPHSSRLSWTRDTDLSDWLIFWLISQLQQHTQDALHAEGNCALNVLLKHSLNLLFVFCFCATESNSGLCWPNKQTSDPFRIDTALRADTGNFLKKMFKLDHTRTWSFFIGLFTVKMETLKKSQISTNLKMIFTFAFLSIYFNYLLLYKYCT